MKPAFKCDYCNFIGTEDEVREHEEKCTNNYDRRSCLTCKNQDGFKSIDIKNNEVIYDCKAGKEIPPNQIFDFCPLYERGEDKLCTNVARDIFGWGF